MPRLDDGSIRQSTHTFDPSDYFHERIPFHVLGVVLSVYASDDRINVSASKTLSNKRKGTRCEARVLVVNDGMDVPWIIPNVVLLPPSSSGIDNYSEELPKGCSQTVDGKQLTISVDPYSLDGDFCLVGFVGGNIKQPYLLKWWPHPKNDTDPATGGNSGFVDQGRRFFKRFQGTKLTINNNGDISLDTSEAGSSVQGSATGITRVPKEIGGNIQVDVKPSKQLEINFNPVVNSGTRQDTSSRLTMTKDEVDMIANAVVNILTRTGNIEVIAAQLAEIIGTSGGVNLGAHGLSSNQGVVQGEGFDPASGLTQADLGNASSVVRAVKG